MRWDQWNHIGPVLVDHRELGLEDIGLAHRHLVEGTGFVVLRRDIDLVVVGRIGCSSLVA